MSPRRAQALVAAKADADPNCIGCHTVGFGTPSGYRREVGASKFTQVGCESCHGASGGGWLAEHYALPATHSSNVAAGLTPLDKLRLYDSGEAPDRAFDPIDVEAHQFALVELIEIGIRRVV